MPDDVDAPTPPAPPADAPRAPGSDDTVRNRSLITRLATTAAANWKATMAIWGVVILVGLVAYGGGLAREGFPPVNLPIVVVDGTYFVDDADTVDADVALPAVKAFTGAIRERSLGAALAAALNPAQQVVTIVHEELTATLSAGDRTLHLAGNPAVIALVGLQGSGKTTTCGKLALWLRRKHKKKTLLVAADVQRPAGASTTRP